MPAQRFRKKPIEVEAVQFTGGNHHDVSAFMGCKCGFGNPVRDDCPYDHSKAGPKLIVIRTLEGDMMAIRGDWIIRGVQGEFYPCKPEIFDATYEPADQPSPPQGAGLTRDDGERLGEIATAVERFVTDDQRAAHNADRDVRYLRQLSQRALASPEEGQGEELPLIVSKGTCPDCGKLVQLLGGHIAEHRFASLARTHPLCEGHGKQPLAPFEVVGAASTQPTSSPPGEGPIPKRWTGSEDGEHWAVEIEHDLMTAGQPFVVTVEVEEWEAGDPGPDRRESALACATPEQAREMAAALQLYAGEAERCTVPASPPIDAGEGEGR